mmetsp:Transcript_37247/g.51438  ORF Transcript_37247/g.51438 Transcript_37247/m.51438 type:complete len:378 (-) Transcript_37247:205-1338(-)|eukprot:CAMPEP_0201490448 /NCGR_PEP_ID=MMETSP0151_2-20130828/26560_1 /ASSEMBLY_ACC=CAM_ASM_000257 /TAXON_ID=200890 /ORGANISM="Paramoeba atlantica, Strain 621/1 / CCAP 1560/9" /LENGTH=377 /DNA_ID=CAMNT_0047876415 /DNA_START=62 /DNA_END=1195 /DNA_ORIENTATION=+
MASGNEKPEAKPVNPNFGSGPTTKHVGWSPEKLDLSTLGRSHRSALCKKKLFKAIEETKRLLRIPEGYKVGIVPASDTGAMEMALWSLLGPRPVDVFHWESFGKEWYSDITNELKLENVNNYSAPFGQIPDLSKANGKNDIVFAWNGTTSGVRVPNGDWIPGDREGITLCDATSGVFAYDMPWEKLDVVTYSWQKVLGGEGAHGMLILSPRAQERAASNKPSWPMPKIFRLLKAGKLNEALFTGEVINTPSMLCVEDYLEALDWVDSIGGLDGMLQRTKNNLKLFEDFVEQNDWISFLPETKEIRSSTSICFSLKASAEQIKEIQALLAKEEVGYDIGGYRAAPPGLRVWGGGNVEASDIQSFLPWLSWAYHQVVVA